ncbi:MAG: hypothetical protein RLZZ246_1976, partial [Planctomycetota bacterium]
MLEELADGLVVVDAADGFAEQGATESIVNLWAIGSKRGPLGIV